jgi:uncharacterized DUF497 family protein
MRFTWDEDKAIAVKKDHGIDFARIIDVFTDLYALEFVDEAHSTDAETRYVIIGLAEPGLVFLVYAEPTPDEIRFITARRAEPWMVEEYEENRT